MCINKYVLVLYISMVVALLLSPYRASLVDIDPVEVDEIILMVSSTLLSCSSMDELEASLSCVKTPAAELPEPAAIALHYYQALP